MARAFGEHLASGNPVPDLERVRALVSELVHHARGDVNQMAKLAVDWVVANPTPMALATPAYRR